MGFVDAVYILDAAQLPVFHFKTDPRVPSYAYIRNQLAIAKRELLITDAANTIDFGFFDSSTTPIFDYSQTNVGSEQGPDSSAMSMSMTMPMTTATTISAQNQESDVVVLPPKITLDKDWNISWCKFDGLYLLTLGSNRPEYVDVVSDDEDEDEDENEVEDESEDHEVHSDTSATTPPNDQSYVGSRGTDNRDEYTSITEESESESESESELESASESESQNKDNYVQTGTEPSTSDVSGEKGTHEETESNSEEKAAVSQSISNTVNPLEYTNFQETFIRATKMMLQTNSLSAHKIQMNSHRIIMLLQELLDASLPFITDLNQLRELLPNNSIIDKLVSATKQIQNNAATSIQHMKHGTMQRQGNGESGYQHLSNGTSASTSSPAFTYATILEKSGNPTPWRRTNIKNSQNEIFLDIYETIDLIVTPMQSTNMKHQKNSYGNNHNYSSGSHSRSHSYSNSAYKKAVIHGHIDLTTSLSGLPTLEVSLSVPHPFNLAESYPSLHKSVDRRAWKNSNGKILQMVPPDGKCKLLTYNIDLVEVDADCNGDRDGNGNDKNELDISKFAGLINVDLISGLGIHRNEFEVCVNTGCGLGAGFGSKDSVNVKDISGLVVEIFLPKSASMDVDSNTENDTQQVGDDAYGGYGANNENGGNNGAESKQNGIDMRVLRSSTGTVTRSQTGNYEWKFEDDVVVGGKFTLRGSIGSAGVKKNSDFANITPQFVRVHYKYHGSIPSGIKVQGIKLLNDSGSGNAKPFKGVKYIASAGEYIVR